MMYFDKGFHIFLLFQRAIQVIIRNNSSTLRSLSFRADALSDESRNLIQLCNNLTKIHIEVPTYAHIQFNHLTNLKDLSITNSSIELPQFMTVLNNFKKLETLRLSYSSLSDDAIRAVASR